MIMGRKFLLRRNGKSKLSAKGNTDFGGTSTVFSTRGWMHLYLIHCRPPEYSYQFNTVFSLLEPTYVVFALLAQPCSYDSEWSRMPHLSYVTDHPRTNLYHAHDSSVLLFDLGALLCVDPSAQPFATFLRGGASLGWQARLSCACAASCVATLRTSTSDRSTERN